MGWSVVYDLWRCLVIRILSPPFGVHLHLFTHQKFEANVFPVIFVYAFLLVIASVSLRINTIKQNTTFTAVER